MSSRNDRLTPEQMAELAELRAERTTPEARDEEAAARAAIEAEYPPAGPDPDTVAALARIRLARERLGLSLTNISERTGIDRTALSRLERGQGNPTIGTLNRVAGALGMRLEWNLVEAASEGV